jgi:hypothetical protein
MNWKGCGRKKSNHRVYNIPICSISDRSRATTLKHVWCWHEYYSFHALSVHYGCIGKSCVQPCQERDTSWRLFKSTWCRTSPKVGTASYVFARFIYWILSGQFYTIKICFAVTTNRVHRHWQHSSEWWIWLLRKPHVAKQDGSSGYISEFYSEMPGSNLDWDTIPRFFMVFPDSSGIYGDSTSSYTETTSFLNPSHSLLTNCGTVWVSDIVV